MQARSANFPWTFSGTDGIFPSERPVHTGADSDMAPHLMVSGPLPAKGLDGLAGIRGNSSRPRKDPPEKIPNFQGVPRLHLMLARGPGICGVA
jgi:hypothetical protein